PSTPKIGTSCWSSRGTSIAENKALSQGPPQRLPAQRPDPGEAGMAYKETFWMACDSTEQMRAEYGPFHTRMEAEIEARKLGFEYLLRYEHIVGKNDEIQEVRSVFLELQDAAQPQKVPVELHTRSATCG